MMRVTLIMDNDVVLWEVCYNSQSQTFEIFMPQLNKLLHDTKCGMK